VSEVKRYYFNLREFGGADMDEDDHGDYVLHSDYDAIRAKLAASETACAQMREALVAFHDGKVPFDIGKDMLAKALATDAGKGWVSTEGAVIGNVSTDCLGSRTWLDGGGPDLPAEWIGSEVYIIKKEQTP
jgi:hypothetical protein